MDEKPSGHFQSICIESLNQGKSKGRPKASSRCQEIAEGDWTRRSWQYLSHGGVSAPGSNESERDSLQPCRIHRSLASSLHSHACSGPEPHPPRTCVQRQIVGVGLKRPVMNLKM